MSNGGVYTADICRIAACVPLMFVVSSSGSSRWCCVSASGVLYVGWARGVGRARTFQMSIAIRKSVALMQTEAQLRVRIVTNPGSGRGPMWLTACVAATAAAQIRDPGRRGERQFKRADHCANAAFEPAACKGGRARVPRVSAALHVG